MILVYLLRRFEDLKYLSVDYTNTKVHARQKIHNDIHSFQQEKCWTN